MKNSQKLAFGLLVAVLAIGFSAFKNAMPSKDADVADAWFVLKTGVLPTAINATNASNYDLVGSEPCGDGSTYCGVQAENVSGQPNLASGTQARNQINTFFGSTPPAQGSRISAHD